MISLDGYRRIHLVGIGGIGTSGVARILAARGLEVTGSDLEAGRIVAGLRESGIRVFEGHRAENLPAETQAVIFSSAVPETNPEIEAARRRGLPLISYSQALGALMTNRFGIAVAGTHGKTTTSAMIASILAGAGREPGFVIGGEVPGLGGNSGAGAGDCLVAEACEYRRNFLHLRPQAVVVNNVEEDHLDYYRDISDINDAFESFVRLVPAGGLVLLNRDCAWLAGNLRATGPTCHTFGFSDADFTAENIVYGAAGTACDIFFRGARLGALETKLAGAHNVLNGLAAFSLAHLVGVPAGDASRALAAFGGVRRRMEFRGYYRRAAVYDDYAHHPSEVSATLGALRQFFPARRIIVVFQPHQFSRTRFFLDDFAAAFGAADYIVVPEIYFVRDSEESRRSVSSRDLADKLNRHGKSAVFVENLDDALPVLAREAGNGDIVLTLGAGPVCRVADWLVGGGREGTAGSGA